jgi:ribosomal protein L32
MSFYFDMYQQGQIAEAKTDAIQAKVATDQYSDRVRELEFTVNRLALGCQAMWELLRSRVGITEEELMAKMNEVDLRDGTQDGRMTPVMTTCPKCGKPSNSRHSRCMYCGATIPKPHVFQ